MTAALYPSSCYFWPPGRKAGTVSHKTRRGRVYLKYLTSLCFTFKSKWPSVPVPLFCLFVCLKCLSDMPPLSSQSPHLLSSSVLSFSPTAASMSASPPSYLLSQDRAPAATFTLVPWIKTLPTAVGPAQGPPQ